MNILVRLLLRAPLFGGGALLISLQSNHQRVPSKITPYIFSHLPKVPKAKHITCPFEAVFGSLPRMFESTQKGHVATPGQRQGLQEVTIISDHVDPLSMAPFCNLALWYPRTA